MTGWLTRVVRATAGVEYCLARSARRRTIEVAVRADKRITVRAPRMMPQAEIDKFVNQHAGWIARKIKQIETRPPPPPPQYMSGERHSFLGAQYPLRVAPARRNSVMLADGCICVDVVGDISGAAVKTLLGGWYHQQALRLFPTMVDDVWRVFDRGEYAKPSLRIRDMKTRWGSMSARGRMCLNTKLIQTPRACIDYVIMHELCHLKHHNHGAGFYRLLAEQMPDWKSHRQTLRAHPIAAN